MTNNGSKLMTESGAKCPFKFLEPFQQGEEDFFFWRGEEVNDIVFKLHNNDVILIYGEPGVGKTSVVNCGLNSRLPKDMVLKHFEYSGDSLDKLISLLKEHIKNTAHKETYILVLDRFEKIFIRETPGERIKLLQYLNNMLSPKKLKGKKLKILFILGEKREPGDILIELGKYSPNLTKNQVNIERLNRVKAVKFIEETCKRYKIQMADEIADMIFEKMHSDDNVDLYFLQAYLFMLYRKVKKKEAQGTSITITKDDVGSSGNMKGNVLDFLLAEKIHKKYREKYKILLKTFASPPNENEIKKLKIEDIQESLECLGGEGFKKEEIEQMTKTLMEMDILVQPDDEEENLFALKFVHFARVVLEWFESDEEDRIDIYDQLKRKYKEHGKNDTLLDKDFLERLDNYQVCKNQVVRNQDANYFVKISREALVKNKKRYFTRRQVLAVSSIILLLIFLCIILCISKEKDSAHAYGVISKILKEKTESYAKKKDWQMFKLYAANFLLCREKANSYTPLDKDITPPAEYSNWVLKYAVTLTPKSRIYSIAFSPEKQYLAVGGEDKMVRILDASTGKSNQLLVGHQSYVETVAFSPDGRFLASGGWDKNIIVRDKEKNWRVKTTLEGHTDTVYSICFSPDGKYLFSAGGDETVRKWDLKYNHQITSFTGHTQAVTSISLYPGKNINLLASGSMDNTVKLRQISTGKKPGTLRGHISAVKSIAFSRDGRLLASGSWDGTIKVWTMSIDENDGKVGARERTTFTGHKNYVESICFSPDGKYLFSGSADKTIKVWSIAEDSEIATLSGHTGNVYSITVSPDGKYLASAGWDSTIRLWEVTSHEEISTWLGYCQKPETMELSKWQLEQELEKIERLTGFRVEGTSPVPVEREK